MSMLVRDETDNKTPFNFWKMKKKLKSSSSSSIPRFLKSHISKTNIFHFSYISPNKLKIGVEIFENVFFLWNLEQKRKSINTDNINTTITYTTKKMKNPKYES